MLISNKLLMPLSVHGILAAGWELPSGTGTGAGTGNQKTFGVFSSADTDDADALFEAQRSDRYGLSTFASVPYVRCFEDDPEIAYDIAILGAPFDTVRRASQKMLKSYFFSSR